MDLVIPRKVYGRENEVSVLAAAWNQTAVGNARTIIITGSSGTGKSTLAKTLREIATRENGIYITGKCEQRATNEPYSVFTHAIRNFLVQLKANSDATQTYWRSVFDSLLRPQIPFISYLVPEFAQFVRNYTRVDEELGNAAPQRFSYAMLEFFRILATQNITVGLLLDDMQWADQASISVLRQLIAENEGRKLLIAICFRDDEIHRDHPFYSTRTNLENDPRVAAIKLESLPKHAISDYTADFFENPEQDVAAITDYVFDVSKGNPLFVQQLLHALHRTDSVHWDQSRNRWGFNFKNGAIGQQEDIVDLIDIQLKSYAPQTRKILAYAANIGSRMTLTELSVVMGIDGKQLLSLLSPVIGDGLLLCDQNELEFLHDRVQQVVCMSLTETETAQIHLEIARAYRRILMPSEIDENLFMLVKHWNLALDLLTDQDEIRWAIELNVAAAKRAIIANAYFSALDYAKHGFEQAQSHQLAVNDSVRFDCHYLYAKSYYLTGNSALSHQYVLTLEQKCVTIEQTARFYRLIKDIFITQGRDYREIVDRGLGLLVKLNVIPETFNSSVQRQILLLETQLFDGTLFTDIPSLIKIGIAATDEDRIFLQILMDVWEAAYYAGNVEVLDLLTLVMAFRSITRGNVSESAFAYVLLSVYLVERGLYEQAIQFGELALKLNDAFDDRILMPKVTNIFCNFVNFHSQPFSRNAELYTRSAVVGRENGDYLFGLWATLFMVWSRYLAGDNISTVKDIAASHQKFVEQTGDKKIQHVFSFLASVVDYWRDEPIELSVKDNSKLLLAVEYWDKEHFLPGKTWYAVLAAQCFYIMGNYNDAVNVIEQYAIERNPSLIMFPISQLDFYYAMSLMRADPERCASDPKTIQYLSETEQKLDGASKRCQENFGIFAPLLRAQRLLLGDQYDQALAELGAAMDISVKFGNPMLKAIAYEHMAQYWEFQKNLGLAEYFFKLAFEYYETWGATRKCRQLVESEKIKNPRSSTSHNERRLRFSEIHESFSPSQMYNSADLNDLVSITDELYDIPLSFSTEQAILKFCVKHTGADRGVYVAKEGADYYVLSILDKDRYPPSKQRTLLSRSNALCQSIAYSAIRTRATVKSDDVARDSNFSSDPYLVEHPVTATICFPLALKQEVIGLVYLEKNQYWADSDRTKIRLVEISLRQAERLLEYGLVKEKLREQETFNRSLVNSLPGAIGVRLASLNWPMVQISDAIKTLTGYQPEEFAKSGQTTFESIIDDKDRPLVVAVIKSAVQGQRPYRIEYRIRTKAGDIRWLDEQGQAIYDSHGLVKSIVAAVFDITEKKIAENALIASEQRMHLSHRFASIGTWEWRRTDKQLIYSGTVAAIFGFDENAPITHSDLINTVHPADRDAVMAAAKEAISSGHIFKIEFRIVQANDTIRWLLGIGGTQVTGTEQAVSLIGIVQDITDRKKQEEEKDLLQRQLQQAQKMEAIGQLSGGIAHDFNNMLNVIIGFSELIKNEVEFRKYPVINGYIDHVLESGRRAADLVKQLLTYSRNNTVEKALTILGDVVNDTAKMLRATIPSSIKIRITNQDATLVVLANRVQISQVLMNLCINARDAIQETGTIDIVIKRERPENTSCAACGTILEDDFAAIHIRDTGCGIDPTNLRKVFDPFFTTKPVGKGTGMGLSMVHGIVHSHGGHIQVTSTLNEGSEFVIYLPIANQLADKTVETVSDTKVNNDVLKNRRIMVVDDEPLVLGYVTDLLKLAGAETVSYPSSQTALEMIRANLNSFDLLITDQTMPDITGTTLLQTVKSTNPRFPVVLCSGIAAGIDNMLETSYENTRFIKKPFSREELLAAIEQVLLST